MQEKNRTVLAAKIKRFRKLKGVTQKEMSESLHISRSCLGNYEIGTRTPDAEILTSIATYLKVDVDTLTGEIAN